MQQSTPTHWRRPGQPSQRPVALHQAQPPSANPEFLRLLARVRWLRACPPGRCPHAACLCHQMAGQRTRANAVADVFRDTEPVARQITLRSRPKLGSLQIWWSDPHTALAYVCAAALTGMGLWLWLAG